MSETDNTAFLTELTTEIVSAYVSNNPTAAAQLPELITTTFQTVNSLSATSASAEPEKKEPLFKKPDLKAPLFAPPPGAKKKS